CLQLSWGQRGDLLRVEEELTPASASASCATCDSSRAKMGGCSAWSRAHPSLDCHCSSGSTPPGSKWASLHTNCCSYFLRLLLGVRAPSNDQLEQHKLA